MFRKKKGYIALDQIRTVDKQRLLKRVGSLQQDTIDRVKDTLHEMLIA